MLAYALAALACRPASLFFQPRCKVCCISSPRLLPCKSLSIGVSPSDGCPVRGGPSLRRLPSAIPRLSSFSIEAQHARCRFHLHIMFNARVG